MFGIWLGVNIGSYVVYKYFSKINKANNLEMREARIALEPLISAERDRSILLQLRRNRDAENELMRYVPGWETGTLYGEPVYHNKLNRFIPLNFKEYYAHAPYSEEYKRLIEKAQH